MMCLNHKLTELVSKRKDLNSHPSVERCNQICSSIRKDTVSAFQCQNKTPAVSLSGCYRSVWIQASLTLGAFAGELLTRGSIHCKLFASASDGAPASKNS